MPALARMTAANLPFVLTPEPLQSPRATSALLLPEYKHLYTGDTCLLIPRVTLPYHNSMACSSHNSGKRSSPLSAKHKCGSDSLAPAQVRTMAQNGPKRPGMAPSAYLIPIWAAAHFRATEASSDPHFKYETAQNGPEWHRNKKLSFVEAPKADGKPLAVHCSAPVNQWLDFPFPESMWRTVPRAIAPGFGKIHLSPVC